jgi:putative acetyltransferase
MHVRTEEPADLPAIHAVHAASFPTAVEARLVDALRAAGRLRVSLVAVERDQVVGHVAFSPVRLVGAPDGAGVAPVAVLPGHRRQGIAERLIRDGLGRCAELGFGFVVVLGDPAYYRRFGFRPAGHWDLSDEYGGGEAFQALELRPASIPPGGGRIHYAPEFSAFEDEGPA